MITLTKNQRNQMMLTGKIFMEQLCDGKSVRDVMANIYVAELDGKTLARGYDMADAIIAGVEAFDNGYHQARNDVDKYLKHFQTCVDKDMTRAERCTYWLRFTAVITAACMMNHGGGGAENPVFTAEKIEALCVTEEEATPILERTLRERAREAIKNSGVMLSGLIEHADAICETGDGTEAATFIVDMGARETDYRAIVAMLVYVKAKSGAFENIPADMKLEQITTLVCAEIEQVKILNQVGSDRMTESLATFLLQVLGMIVIASLFSAFASCAIGFVTQAFGAILVIPAVLVTVAGTFRLTLAACRAWLEDSGRIVRCVSFAVEKIVSGATRLAHFIRERVIGQVVDTAKNLFRRLNDWAFDDATDTARQTAADAAT